MPQLLTTNALIVCPHMGVGTTIPTDPKMQINGGFVCVENDVGTLACPFLVYPCIGYRLQSMGLNATEIDHRKAVLVTDFNQTFTGLPLLMTEFHQFMDQSTPAPIPAGQAAPPLSPELTDVVRPVVLVPPTPFPFKISPPPTPAPVTISFNVSADHPLRWILTLINQPLRQHVDLTNGIPGSVTVTPSGGAWNTPAVTVTVTMTTAFLTALTAGTHELYLTGVTRRGLSGYNKATIVVSP